MNTEVQSHPRKRIRVMIVEDSRPVREMLEHIIGGDPRLEVAASLASAEDALKKLHQIAPDVISMDIRLPGMNGFEATQRIMAEKPTPIVVVSASVESEELKISMNALRAGALSVMEKPVNTSHRDYGEMAARLCTQLVIMSEVRVIRQRVRRNLGLPALAARQKALLPLRPHSRPWRELSRWLESSPPRAARMPWSRYWAVWDATFRCLCFSFNISRRAF